MPRIENTRELATSPLRADALAIAEAAYQAIDVTGIVERKVVREGDTLVVDGKSFPLAGRNVYVIAAGKCSFVVGHALEHILGSHLTAGVALDVSPVDHASFTTITAYRGTHPLPSEVNESATAAMLALLERTTEQDLVIMAISGGGSTLLCQHEKAMTCLNESQLFTELTHKGATIQEINTVRKHTSRVRGGGLAAAAYPAEVISLIFSDVPGNDMAFIASGPTVPDTSSIADALALLTRYEVAVPAHSLIETQKDPKYFARVTNTLLLTSEDALEAMSREAVARGYRVEVVDDHLTGESRDTGRAIVNELHSAPAATARLFAGETTVTIDGAGGEGGRNQEMALAVVDEIGEGELLLPFASDGHDNTDHAGAIADLTTRDHAFAQTLSVAHHLAEHRSYDFFKASGDALVTGYTGSNVSDLIIALKK